MFSEWWSYFLLDALALLVALALDRLLPEPPNVVHAVAWMGRAISWLARFAPKPPAGAFLYGCVVVGVLVGFLVGSGAGAVRAVGPGRAYRIA